jgi:hypothetical protein
MQPLNFWAFLWRCIDRTTTDSANFFGWDLKSACTTVLLVVLGFIIYWRIKGLSETKQEVTKFLIITAAPLILFLAALLLYNAFRAPYLLYVEEFNKLHVQLNKTEGRAQAAESERDSLKLAIADKDSKIASLQREMDEKDHKKIQAQTMTGPATPQPLLARIRIASQKTVVSTNPNPPYALQVVVQTDQSIQPVAFIFECDGEVADGHGGVGAGVYTKSKKWTIEGHPNWYAIEWETPAFAPETPMVVTLLSKTAVHVTAVTPFQYSWP